MEATWIVAANAGRARLFSRLGAARRLSEIGDMVNTAARLRTPATESDNLGRRSASTSGHGVSAPAPPNGYEPQPQPGEHQTEMFARSLANHLLQARQQGRYTGLVLIASPEFLGVLRKQLDPKIAAVVTTQIDKDYTQCTPIELLDNLQAHAERV